MAEIPEVHYARSGDVSIAYQVVGEGPVDIVFVRALTGDLLSTWDQPLLVRHVLGLAQNGRLLMLDKRGTGLSDGVAGMAPTLETRMDDVRAVMDAVDSDEAVLWSGSEGSQVTTLFAATYPERTSGLIVLNPSTKGRPTPDYPWAPSEAEWREKLRDVHDGWGTREFFDRLLRAQVPTSLAENAAFGDWFVTHMRRSASPGAAMVFHRMMREADVGNVLPSVRVPTLVLHSRERREPSEYFARHVPSAELRELTTMRGEFTWTDDATHEETMAAVSAFATGLRPREETDRILTTVMFTDIVGSTGRAAELGDRAWRDLALRASREGTSRARPVPRARDRHRRRRLPGNVRRTGARGPLCAGDHGRGSRARHPDPGRHPHGRGRGGRRRGARDRCAHRRPRGRTGRSERGPRLIDGEGPRRGIRPRLRGHRRARAEGCPRPLAPLPGRELMDVPETRYAKTADGVYIAYQVVGEGPTDLVYVPGFSSRLELAWENPLDARFLRSLASYSRLVLIDRRGSGLSDPVPGGTAPPLEAQMEDVRSVLDAIGSERAAVFGAFEGGPLCALFAATYPERTSALLLYASYARGAWAADYPWAWTDAEMEEDIARLEAALQSGWTDDYFNYWMEETVPSLAHDPAYRPWLRRMFQSPQSPGASIALLRMEHDVDVRAVLPTIKVPTLVMNRTRDRVADLEEGRWIADQIEGATFVELPGVDHPPWAGEQSPVLEAIGGFLGAERPLEEIDRVLATVLFTDIVGSTERAASMGDRDWTDLLARHHQIVRAGLARHRGVEVDTAGDGFLATFDGPARAAQAALELCETMRNELGDRDPRGGSHRRGGDRPRRDQGPRGSHRRTHRRSRRALRSARLVHREGSRRRARASRSKRPASTT